MPRPCALEEECDLVNEVVTLTAEDAEVADRLRPSPHDLDRRLVEFPVGERTLVRIVPPQQLRRLARGRHVGS